MMGRASAIVCGEMVECDEPGGTATARDTLRRVLDGFPGPVLFGFPSGHTAGATWTLPFGVAVEVVADSLPAVIILESAVS